MTPRTPAGRPSWQSGTPHLRLRLLDGFALEWDGAPLPLPVSAQRLLALLALRTGIPTRAHAASALWPRTATCRARANLRSALWRLRQISSGLVGMTGEQLILTPTMTVDAVELRGSSRAALNGGTPDLDLLLVGGELLPEWDDSWVAVERTRLNQLRLHALEQVCAQLAAAERFGEAIDAGLAAVRADPLRESAHRALIAVHLAEGNAAEAVRSYRACRAMLRRDLGVGPSEQLERLVALHPTLVPG